MIRSILTLRAATGQAGALEDLYARQGVLARARQFPGCRDAVLLRSAGGDPATGTHLVIADWDSIDDYQRWIEDPWRAALSRQLADLLAPGSGELIVGKLFEFI